MLENVRGLLDTVFDDYRIKIQEDLKKLGYVPDWRLLNASDFGVPQLRPRVIFVAIRKDLSSEFSWPIAFEHRPPSVGECLFDLIKARGWLQSAKWKKIASDIAPTIVGGSKKHGGPDLGPTRAKKAWATLGVDGHGVVELAPERDFIGMPRLTPRMIARLQGFTDDWEFFGKKTSVCRQIGNAFPPPVANAVGQQLIACLNAAAKKHLKVA